MVVLFGSGIVVVGLVQVALGQKEHGALDRGRRARLLRRQRFSSRWRAMSRSMKPSPTSCPKARNPPPFGPGILRNGRRGTTCEPLRGRLSATLLVVAVLASAKAPPAATSSAQVMLLPVSGRARRRRHDPGRLLRLGDPGARGDDLARRSLRRGAHDLVSLSASLALRSATRGELALRGRSRRLRDGRPRLVGGADEVRRRKWCGPDGLARLLW